MGFYVGLFDQLCIMLVIVFFNHELVSHPIEYRHYLIIGLCGHLRILK
jgi:hypothetical protein